MADAQAPAEVEAPPAATQSDAKWPYEAKDDAIFKTHDALRADLADFAKALEAMEAAQAGEAPRGSRLWMLTNLKKWFHAFEHNYKHHFEVQDKFFFPMLATKVSKEELHASGEMSHAKMLANLQHLSTAIAGQSTQAAWDLTTIKKKFTALDEAVRAHLEAVEKGPIELMRREMSHKDVKWVLEKHVVSDGGKQDVGWLLARAFQTDAARDDWLARVPMMPKDTRKNAALPAAHAYLDVTHKILKEIIEGKHTAGNIAAGDAGGCCVIA